ncbi:MAG: peptidase [Flavobacteriales bacterium]|nr:peptidase [Flavobacteriales bacterium]NNK80459.1 peptidase [Flavobacteriales bacterium]
MAKKKIGRFDRADFPELGLEHIKVKVDTGAYTSCLYATGIHTRKYKGKKHLYFKSLSPEHPSYHGRTHRFSEYSQKEVKSSNGKIDKRYFIDTVIVLFGQEYPITFSLADRRSMRYPVLLGRRLIRSNFIVDVNKSNISLKQSSEENS